VCVTEREIKEIKCFVYKEKDILSSEMVLMVHIPLICQQIKVNLISHAMTYRPLSI